MFTAVPANNQLNPARQQIRSFVAQDLQKAGEFTRGAVLAMAFFVLPMLCSAYAAISVGLNSSSFSEIRLFAAAYEIFLTIGGSAVIGLTARTCDYRLTLAICWTMASIIGAFLPTAIGL